MTIASKLLQYIFFAPDDVKQKCSLFRKTQLELNQGEKLKIKTKIKPHHYDEAFYF